MKRYIRSLILPHIVEVLKQHKKLTLAIDLLYKDIQNDTSRANKYLSIESRTSQMGIAPWFPWGNDEIWVKINKECLEKSSIKLKNN